MTVQARPGPGAGEHPWTPPLPTVLPTRPPCCWRPAALLAGPTALLSIGLLAAALVVTGSEDLAMAASPVAVASSAVGLVSLLLLLLAEAAPSVARPGWAP